MPRGVGASCEPKSERNAKESPGTGLRVRDNKKEKEKKNKGGRGGLVNEEEREKREKKALRVQVGSPFRSPIFFKLRALCEPSRSARVQVAVPLVTPMISLASGFETPPHRQTRRGQNGQT